MGPRARARITFASSADGEDDPTDAETPADAV
jgi:hypothetical protein